MATGAATDRLPTNVTPAHYDLRFQPNLEDRTFKGEANIRLLIKQTTLKIVLNAVNLKIQKAIYSPLNGIEKLVADEILNDLSSEKVTFVFSKPLESSVGTLKISFSGNLETAINGFYCTSYKSVDGHHYKGAATQFEPKHARRAFPCWDEPSFKSTFSVTLVVPMNRQVLSNTAIKAEKEDEQNPDLKCVAFRETPPMSTYLLAWIIGNFEYLEKISSDKVRVRVFTPVGMKDKGNFALDTATEALKYYKRYFSMEYPLSKMDLVAIPDFPFKAMENWGLVTFRENCLLVDPNNSSSKNKQTVALIICHEIAHQWFGNLVTMDWWNDIWLKEGFAQFMEYRCVNFLYPEYEIWRQFILKCHNPALEVDALKNSHPIESLISKPSDMEEIFDEITFYKGATLIRMLHSFLDDPGFRRGLSSFLEKHKFQTAKTEDLWKALEETSGKPVSTFMKMWTQKSGFPLVHVSLHEDEQGTYINLQQEQFLASKVEESSEMTWMVPINICISPNINGPWKEIVMEKATERVFLDGLKDSQWFKVNPGLIGFFRVQYESEILQKFIPAIQNKMMMSIDRMGVLSDLYALVRAGRLSSSKLFQLLPVYREETDYTVWAFIIRTLYEINALLEGSILEPTYKKFVKTLLKPIFSRVGWDDDPNEGHTSKLLRVMVLEALSLFEDENVLLEAKDRFKDHISGQKNMPADIRQAVYKAVAVVGHKRTYEQLISLYKGTTLLEEKIRISNALGMFRSESTIARVLEFSLSKAVRPQDSIFIIQSACQYHAGREMTWKFLKSNFETIWEQYNSGIVMRRLVKHVTGGFKTLEHAKEVTNFFQSNAFPGIRRTVRQVAEEITVTANWLSRDLLNIKPTLEAAICDMNCPTEITKIN